MVLSEKVEVRVAVDAKYGTLSRGVFAKEAFKAGDKVWWTGAEDLLHYFTRAEIEAEPDVTRQKTLKAYSFMIDHDTYSSTDNPDEDPSWYFNHSCNGNCWYQDDDNLVAMRDIAVGEELAYDYAVTETEASFHAGMQCLCGTAECRGIFTGSTWRSPTFSARYANHNYSLIQRKTRERGWHDPRVYVCRLGENNLGARTLASISKGEPVVVFSGKVVEYSELAAMHEAQVEHVQLILQVSEKLWQVVDPATGPESGDYINHSCEANCGMADSVTLVAMRDIAAGEDITMDYCMVNTGTSSLPVDNFACDCGTVTCRGKVTSKDWQDKDIQGRYKGFFSPCVQACIDGATH